MLPHPRHVPLCSHRGGTAQSSQTVYPLKHWVQSTAQPCDSALSAPWASAPRGKSPMYSGPWPQRPNQSPHLQPPGLQPGLRLLLTSHTNYLLSFNYVSLSLTFTDVTIYPHLDDTCSPSGSPAEAQHRTQLPASCLPLCSLKVWQRVCH